MSGGRYSPDPFLQFSDAEGRPLGGGFLYTYTSGTTQPETTYSDVGLTVANPNPVILGSDGRNPDGALFLAPGIGYRFLLQDLNHNTILVRDNITV